MLLKQNICDGSEFMNVAKSRVRPRYQHGHAFIHGRLHPAISYHLLSWCWWTFTPWVPSAAPEEVSGASHQVADTVAELLARHQAPAASR